MLKITMILLALSAGVARAEIPKPLALVYRGPGTCWKGCAESAALVAWHAGYRVRFVGAEDPPGDLFRTAKIWIQPGGRAIDQARAMSANLKRSLRIFVEQGGGYVGFCAGAFLASRQFGWEEKDGQRVSVEGLGLLPVKSRFFFPEPHLAAVLPIRLSDGATEHFYWELGPYIDARQAAPGVEFLGFYPGTEDYYAAAARGTFGEGRVIVTGFHPEAPNLWRRIFGLKDPDGEDSSYAERMIEWAGGPRR